MPAFLPIALLSMLWTVRPGLSAASAGQAPPSAAGAGTASNGVASDGATIEGTVSVSILSSTLKHWGIPGAEAAFVPDSDYSAQARAIRAATGAAELCAAIDAARTDAAVTIAPADGDGDLEHRSGDEARLEFRIAVPLSSPASGRVYLCTAPVVAIVTRGAYPDERFERADGHRLSWTGRRIALHPGEQVHVHLASSIDASRW